SHQAPRCPPATTEMLPNSCADFLPYPFGTFPHPNHRPKAAGFPVRGEKTAASGKNPACPARTILVMRVDSPRVATAKRTWSACPALRLGWPRRVADAQL